MTTDQSHFFFGDQPVQYPGRDDSLGYAPFAKSLAESIYRMSPTEGLVLGIHGPWGTGKTTLINFVTYYLYNMPVLDQPIIVRFNPWWFSGREDLIRRFFDQLQAVLRMDQQLWTRLREPLADLAEIVSESPIPYSKSLRRVGNLLRKKDEKKDVTKLKEKITKVLTSNGKRILVIMDDIDRLSTQEIREIFALMKSVADFPFVSYMVAFDKDLVAKSLEGTQGASGYDYMEKIIQVPIDLPMMETVSLTRLFLDRLSLVLGETPSELFDSTYWGNVYNEAIRPLVRTPRHVSRLLNAMRVTYPAILGEVNSVDFIAIETIRVFFPDVYGTIRDNGDRFSGHTEPSETDDLKSYCESLFKHLDDAKREILKTILVRIFPRSLSLKCLYFG